jgi:hypothetical protein
MIRPPAVVALLAFLVVPSSRAGEVPDATLVLEATVGVPGTLPAAAPPRFLLRRDGTVFVGGSAQIYTGLLVKDEVKAIENRVKALRKAGSLGPSVAFGDDTTKRYRLRVLKDGARDVVITGDPAAAPLELQGLALLVSDLASFDHPSLRPWLPTEYAVSAREGVLVGGCREWLLPLSLDDVLAGPQRLAAEEVERWPRGADPSSVCRDGRYYVVTLRPLLPGEQP